MDRNEEQQNIRAAGEENVAEQSTLVPHGLV